MKTISTKLIIAVLVLFSASAFAQFTVDGQFRTRFQMLHGYKAPVKTETEAMFGADQQSRLIFNYKTEKLETRLTLQDARVWGSDDRNNATGGQGSTYGFGVYEAWAQVKMGENSQLRVGRQEWKYNGGRLLSHRGWWTTGLSYDGLLYMMHKKDAGLFLDAGISYNNGMDQNTGSYINDVTGRLKTVNFLNVKKVINSKFNATFNFVFSGKQDVLNAGILYMKATEGIMLNYNLGKKAEDGVFGTLSAYFQHGENANAAGGHSAVSAYLVDAQVGFRTMEKKLEISAGVELMSGHDQSNTDSTYNTINHTFDLLNGGRHPYYGGNLDYFVMPSATKNGGLMDPYLKVNYKTSDKGMMNFALWVPMLGTNVKSGRMDTSGDAIMLEKGLGYGIDLGYKHKFSKEVSLMVGASYFIMSDSFKEMKGFISYDANNEITGDDLTGQQYFVYTMLIIKPNFFNSEKK
jgi:hypothetical protein